MSVDRITITALYASQQMENVFHVVNTDGFMTLSQVADEIESWWIGDVVNRGIHAWVVNSVVWVKIQVQEVSPTTSTPFVKVVNRPGQQAGSNELVPFACVILKFQTETAGRTGRGRQYVPTIANGFHTNGLINATFHTYADTAIGNLRDRFLFGGAGNGPLYLVICPRNNPANYKKVISINASAFIGCQRRRNIGFGI